MSKQCCVLKHEPKGRKNGGRLVGDGHVSDESYKPNITSVTFTLFIPCIVTK